VCELNIEETIITKDERNNKVKKTMVILVMLVALTGCKRISQTETVANAPAGIYTLITVDGLKLPATVSHDGHDITVHSGTFTINADKTCVSKNVFSPPSGKKVTREVKATYTQEGSTLDMQWIGAGRTTGTVKGNTFTMNNEGMIFSYKKQPKPLDTD